MTYTKAQLENPVTREQLALCHQYEIAGCSGKLTEEIRQQCRDFIDQWICDREQIGGYIPADTTVTQRYHRLAVEMEWSADRAWASAILEEAYRAWLSSLEYAGEAHCDIEIIALVD